MRQWQSAWQEWSKLTGWNQAREPLDHYVNWWIDCVSWTYLNLWFLPYRMPGLYSDADKWVSQFTLNGIKSTNICRPS